MPCSYKCGPLVLYFLSVVINRVAVGEMPWVRVADDKRGFVLSDSAKPFVPWGFNYDHDENGRLLEDYWDKEWPKVEEDFREMKQLGANVVRIHLQIAKFMTGPEKTNEANLERLGLLVALAEKTGIYLDITGLACYRKKDVPKWYDDLSEKDRWDVQARFWEAVAGRCAKSPAIFCYDLMNEPVVPGGKRNPGDWLGPPFLGSESGYFVQCISLDQKDRPRPAIARQWCHRLVTAIRKQDQRHLVTVGLVPWSLDRPGLDFGLRAQGDRPRTGFHRRPPLSREGQDQGGVGNAVGLRRGQAGGHRGDVPAEMLAAGVRAVPRRVKEDGLWVDRVLLGQDAGGMPQVEHDPGRPHARLAGGLPEAGRSGTESRESSARLVPQ